MSIRKAGEMVSEAKQRITNLTPEQVAQEMASGSAVVLDIRERKERQQRVIPGALHAPCGMLEFYADSTTPYHRPEFTLHQRIILYCASGGRSALAADTLQHLGYTNVAHLDGGLKAWQAQGHPTEVE